MVAVNIQNMPKESADRLHWYKRKFGVRSIRETVEILMDLVSTAYDIDEVAESMREGRYKPEISTASWPWEKKKEPA